MVKENELNTYYFISDLHLTEDCPKICHIFIDFLNNCHPQQDILYILGDFFELWLGDDDLTEFNTMIIRALQNASQRGLAIYLMHGNRDFLIGKRFAQLTGCRLLPDPCIVTVFSNPVLLMHGDTLCTLDMAYQKARKFMRNYWLQNLFLLLPLTSRRRIGKSLRKKSNDHINSTPREVMDVVQQEVEDIMHNQQVNYLIHGHTHRPGIHQFTSPHGSYTRIVLGAWHDQGNVLCWTRTGEKKLLTI